MTGMRDTKKWQSMIQGCQTDSLENNEAHICQITMLTVPFRKECGHRKEFSVLLSLNCCHLFLKKCAHIVPILGKGSV